MKRLTKDERTGATAIALVALLICGCSFWWSRRDRCSKDSEEIVKSIILVSDSTVSKERGDIDEEFSSASVRDKKDKGDRRKAKKGDKKEKKGRSKNSEGKNKKETAPSRDFLSDPL